MHTLFGFPIVAAGPTRLDRLGLIPQELSSRTESVLLK